MSQPSCDSIFATLTQHFTNVGVTVVNNLFDLESLIDNPPDLVFLGMEYIPANPSLGLSDSNKIWLSDFLDNHGVAYTGSSKIAHELERNKPLAKQRVLDAKLNTSAFCVIKQKQSFDNKDLPLLYPLFIKPTNRGGGFGIDSYSVVYNFDQLRTKVNSITTQLHTDVLIEEYLPGREFSVAILKDEQSQNYVTMPIELVAPLDENGVRLLSNKIKSSNAEQVLEVTDKITKDKVTELALAVFHTLEGRDYGRIDIRLDASGRPQFLEANLIPSLICDYGSFPKACVMNICLEYEAMIMRIVRLGLRRDVNNAKTALVP
jgi:D-alanine-D-alanine ligase